ncbi:RNA ligase family protein [Methylomonas koyamae]|uniref:RNA ligase family protein n=1 Tax=Methylomonas koyamae TaxID=702114 RepID=UPI002873B914|nr:RNA ligase family protein [Methylomonas koyamae]WNB75900.1 RNA ligase family protein [Methylomonas koyamae]
MKNDFFKFPSTPHLAIYGNTEVRGDKVMSEAERTEFLQHELIVEEKVDGANLGISFDHEGNIRAQSRGSYLHIPYSGQWKKLAEWLRPRVDELFEQLTDKYILYGEWCYAQHSITYDSLPDWFLGFDVFDKNTEKFFSSPRRNEMFNALGIYQVPLIQRGYFTLAELESLVSRSQLSSHPAEGIYLRFDQGDWLEQRAKLVRSNFIQEIEKHWSRSTIKPNRLKPSV